MAKKKTTTKKVPKVAKIPTPITRQPQAPEVPVEPEQEPYAIRFELPDAKTGENKLVGQLILTPTGMVFKGELDRSAEMFFNKAIELYNGYLGRQARIKLLEAEIAKLR